MVRSVLLSLFFYDWSLIVIEKPVFVLNYMKNPDLSNL